MNEFSRSAYSKELSIVIKLSMNFFLDSLQQFYGTDWLGMFCQFIGMLLIARKQSLGFIIFALGNGAWIAYAAMTGSMPQIFANLVVMGFNFYGYWNWRRG